MDNKHEEAPYSLSLLKVHVYSAGNIFQTTHLGPSNPDHAGTDTNCVQCT